MTELVRTTPGVAGYASDSFTQVNAAWLKAPSNTYVGYTADDLLQHSLVGIVTETGELKLSAFAAADGSQIPVGITCHAVTVGGAADSNSLADSNSGVAGSDSKDAEIWTDGKWNYDVLTVGAGWTMDLLNRVLAVNGRNFTTAQIKTATPTEPAS